MKAKHALGVMVALIGGVIQVQSSNVFNYPSTAKTVGKGNELLKRRDYEKARQYYDAAIVQDPTAWGAYVNRAVVFIHQRKWDLAIQDLNTVTRLKPGHLLAAILRGQVNQYLGNYSRALADYDSIVSITDSLPLTRAVALNSRAWLQSTCPDASFRNGRQAVADAKSACDSTSLEGRRLYRYLGSSARRSWRLRCSNAVRTASNYTRARGQVCQKSSAPAR